ncbi:hypothetical protein [Janthinobacterium sp. PC23-8]|uniref:hypothetical protein n=1 Tax=Janthinobacterium sp. PC23-8 TaxID=2012679 RepID=UPI00113FFDEA|nr:hypothetical protein [Janthinobacterium sp. PC23-8]
MYRKLLLLCLTSSYFFCSYAHAQYSSVSQDRGSLEKTRQLALEADLEKLMGRRFWITPNPAATRRKEFISAEDDGTFGSEKFVVTEATSFTISAFVHKGYQDYVKITFPDGKMAYLEENILFRSNRREYGIFKDLYRPGDTKFDFIEYILPASPEELRIAEKKAKAKAASAAAAWKARGGVRIGMTAKQVRASNWGGPESINRSTGSYGTHEQWVYGGGNYIYFENGIVSSIQN